MWILRILLNLHFYFLNARIETSFDHLHHVEQNSKLATAKSTLKLQDILVSFSIIFNEIKPKYLYSSISIETSFTLNFLYSLWIMKISSLDKGNDNFQFPLHQNIKNKVYLLENHNYNWIKYQNVLTVVFSFVFFLSVYIGDLSLITNQIKSKHHMRKFCQPKSFFRRIIC